MPSAKKPRAAPVKSATAREFWGHFDRLPPAIQDLARKNYRLWREDHLHPSLRFKKVGAFWSVRIGEAYRALGYRKANTSSGCGSARMMNTSA
jgi:hypothetical protein